MADPTPYVPGYSYSGWQATNPSKPLPGPQVDNDFANASRSINEIIDALRNVRRSDGALANESVGPDQLSPALSIGFTFKGVWTLGATYSTGDGVVFGSAFYSSRLQHEADGSNGPGNTAYWNYLFSLDEISVAGALAAPVDNFVGTGSQREFELSFTPVSDRNLWVMVGGKLQSVGDYTVSGARITFVDAPPAGYKIQVRGFATTASLVTPIDGSVTNEKLAPGAVTTLDKVTFNTLADARELKQKLLMVPYTNNADATVEIFPGASFTSQGCCELTISGTPYLFIIVRSALGVGGNYSTDEKCVIIQYPFLEDGSVGTHIAFSQPLNVGHGGGVSGYINNLGEPVFVSWMPTQSAHQYDDAGKGFSTIKWRGSLTSDADVTSYQTNDWNGGTGKRSNWKHMDCSVDETGTYLATIAYQFGANSDTFIDQVVSVFDFQAMLNAPNDAARLQIDPLVTFPHPAPNFDRGMYKQGIAIRRSADGKGGLIATISGFTNPFVPEAITLFDMNGRFIRRVSPTNLRSVYGYANLMNHPTLGTPYQFEPEGLYFRSDDELIFLMMDQWRSGASIVKRASPNGGPTKNFSRIGSATATNVDPMTQVDQWSPTGKADNRGDWVASPSPDYEIGTVTKREKAIFSLRVPRGDAGELPLGYGMPGQWGEEEVLSFEMTPNISFKLGSAFDIYAKSRNMGERLKAASFLYTVGGNSSWRIRDVITQAGPEVQLTYRWDSGNRQFGGVQFGDVPPGGTIAPFGLWYGLQDSNNAGEYILRTTLGSGFRVRSGAVGTLDPYAAGMGLGSTGNRFGAAFAASLDLTGDMAAATATVTGQVSAAQTKTAGVPVASLPAAASNQDARRIVTDATATTFNSIVAGGGSNRIPVWSDGTNWRIG